MKINSFDNFGYVVSIDRVIMGKRDRKEDSSDRKKLKASDRAKELAQSGSSLTPERLELIIQRIQENFYDQEEILKEVANRMLNSKELQELLKKTRKKNNL